MTLLLVYLALAIGVSFFCSIAEAVLLSVRPSYIATLQEKKRPGAKVLAKLRARIDRPLAAILTANTIAHTVGAAGVGAQSAIVFGNAYLGATSAVLTLLILIFSEIIPKSLGAAYWQKLAPPFGMMIWWLTILLTPAVIIFEQLTRFVSRGADGQPTFTRDEMQAMAQIGAEEGAINAREHRILSNVMKLNRLTVRDIMTPRPVIFSVSEGMSVNEFFQEHSEKPFSRILVYDDNPDSISGYVLKNDLLLAQARDDFSATLGELKRDILTIPDFRTASVTFGMLMEDKSHIALIVDEYGTVQGLVTLEDIVETLLGLEITDEQDVVEDMQKLARKRWRERMSVMGINADAVEDNKSGS
ncbi:hemolysin family protein [Henriciella sp.]|jgi:CBS domain containing-hemolysin-like protein|uniref:hemolysin family protein n=1 Tax=Henriciella sp. TaxID=1968823 RepID=UPI000C0D074F|nr:hemolysin family protein [Henriciella sp.]PHR76781.1 MAG: hemolysin [Henriciella sp.]